MRLLIIVLIEQVFLTGLLLLEGMRLVLWLLYPVLVRYIQELFPLVQV